MQVECRTAPGSVSVGIVTKALDNGDTAQQSHLHYYF